MSARSAKRAFVCHSRFVHGIAIAVATVLAPVAGCGGELAGSSDDLTARDASPGKSAPDEGCPSVDVIESGAALGRSCAPEGTYCFDPACDPCTRACAAVRCDRGAWATAVDTALCTGDGDGDAGGGGAAVADAGKPDACVAIDPTGFDRECAQDSDCVAVAAGSVCPDGVSCLCPAASISASEQTRYDATFGATEAQAKPGPPGCMCPYFGRPRCVAGTCTLCGGASGEAPGCPDGG